jgi:hypothetical protein
MPPFQKRVLPPATVVCHVSHSVGTKFLGVSSSSTTRRWKARKSTSGSRRRTSFFLRSS